ncbi:uncharacterized protein BDV14DRAFT_206718 [Aspergillus stella-maris]|uniref:uncharacterized protein n=1 Tax=Aspergillus stella-maris TaxID=1810926 RepID=UPI003CCCC0E3
MPRGQTRAQTPSRGTTRSRNRAMRDSPKVPTACLLCRQRKVKCSGTSPCIYCTKRGLDCSFSEHGKRRAYSVARIEYLEARLASYETGAEPISPLVQVEAPAIPLSEESSTIPGLTRARRSSTRIGNNAFLVESLGALPGTPRPNLATNNTPGTIELSPGSAIAADSSLSSSYTFGSRVQSLLNVSRSGQRRQSTPNATNYLLQPPPQNMPIFSISSLPTEREAFQLLETFVFYIGHTQNYIDAREISDMIGLLYANQDNTTYTESLWTMELLLVFAIARLFTGDFGDELHRTDSFPGYSLFDFVRGRIPPLSQLYGIGRVGVEVMALVAVYLQNIYRKEEAYVYVSMAVSLGYINAFEITILQISTALRLAVSHGFHRPSGAEYLQSEATHINRLWWSVYHQERRLAAATGSPPGISDAAVEQPLPTDSIGFTPSAPMRTSIKLAQVYGQVMTVLYRSTPQAEDTFVSNVQSIIRGLYDISDEIPMELGTGMPKAERDLSLRTSAALHLMFYQALLLTIRPVMLHIAQLVLSGKPPQAGILYSSPIGKLCRTCTEAARRLLKVLMALRQNKALALFGFFDFDGIFSVTFIMILAAILDSACTENQRIQPTPGLSEALDLIHHVADHENKFAAQWLCDIEKTWAQLCTRLDMPESYKNISRRVSPDDSLTQTARPSQVPDDADNTRIETPDRDNTPLRQGAPEQQSILADLDLWSDINYLWAPLPEDWEMPQNNHNATIPQSLYQNIYGNQQWALTGEDMGDFAELGRHVGTDHPS